MSSSDAVGDVIAMALRKGAAAMDGTNILRQKGCFQCHKKVGTAKWIAVCCLDVSCDACGRPNQPGHNWTPLADRK